MVRNVYGLPSETQDSSEAGLLTQGYVFPVGKRYASTIEVCDADRVLYHREILFGTAEEARIDLTARLRVTEGITREGVQSLLYAEDDYRGTFRLAEHRTAGLSDHLYEMVATDVLRRFREYDRVAQPNLSKQEWAELRESIRNGFIKPVVVTYFQDTRRALLTEGNHRLAIAEELGIPAVPVRVTRYAKDYVGNRGIEVPGIEGNRNGYVPADLLPSQIGIPTVAAKTAAILLEHYSRMPNLREVRPEYYGSGIAGAEKRRQRNDPGTWVDRAYFYEYGSTPEPDLQGANRYIAELPPDARIYDIAQDTDNLKARSLNPSGGVDLTLLERNIKDAGYFGFKNSTSSMPNAVGIFYAVPVTREQEETASSEESGNIFDTHEPVSIGDIRPQNRYLGELAMIERFVKEAGSTEEYLQSLGASPDAIQFIMTQPTDLAKRLVNETRKNPAITVQQMEDFVAKFTGQPKYEPTRAEHILAGLYLNIEGMKDWILLQLKKHRVKKVAIDSFTEGLTKGYSPNYEFTYTFPEWGETQEMRLDNNATPPWFFRELDQIKDWARITNPQLSSYDFASAKAASDKWHAEIAEQGEGGRYQERNIVYTFKNGWTVQLVKSDNDLQLEGNLMGHCVGGYCEQVTMGNSIIYSLRDPKNLPHATIEVKGDIEHEPDENDTYPYYTPGPPVMHGPTKEQWDIVQIQGKQNQEPIPEYKAMIKEWLSTIKGKKSMGDDQKNLDDALYYAAQDMKANEEILDKYANAGEGDVDEYGIPVEYQVSDPSDITTRTVGNYERYINLNRRYYRYRGDLADSLADAAWKADEDFFSKPENDWSNHIRDYAARYPSLQRPPGEDIPDEEKIKKFIDNREKYSAVQDMYKRNDAFYEDFQQHYLDSWFDDWVRSNPEPDQEDEDYETFAQFELAHDKWEKQREEDEQEAMDRALEEDPFGGFYSAFFERLNQIALRRDTPFEAWRKKQLSYAAKPKPTPRKRTPR